jgi:CRP-like cAMP-binding protein
MTDARVLELVDIFSDLTPRQLQSIYTICQEKVFAQGVFIVEENTPSQEFYIILDGEVEILVSADQTPEGKGRDLRRIALLKTGQTFGEIALVDQGLRSASARCVSKTCRLLMIDRDAFMKLLKSNLNVGFTVMYNLAADLCLKIRQTQYLMREGLLYGPRREV